MQFLFPSLTIGFALLAVPLLVHLINVLRQRRRKWAAMDFLLASYRKQRKWIWLRQLMLLLLRTAVIACLIGMLAGWMGRSGWLDAIGGQTNHHIIVLDDSMSMSDESGGQTAYRRALTAVDALGKQLLASDGTQQLTVIRTSRAQLIVQAGSTAGDAAADLSAQTLGADSRSLDRLMATEPSSLSGGIAEAVDLAASLQKATTADRTVLYLLTDFRQSDWETPERINSGLQELQKSETEVRIIDCSSNPAGNLGITKLSPVEDVWVAGVPVIAEVTVRNYGKTAVKNITLDAEVVRYGRDAATPRTDQLYSGKVDALPSMVIDQIAPGKEVTKRFQIFIAEPGTHGLTVSIPADTLLADNTRCCTLPLIEQQKVLIIDGDSSGQGAYFVASVLNPGSQVRTGALPDVRPPSYLTSASADELAAYRVIYLIDLPRIADAVARNLKEYVSSGGGLALFLGDSVDRAHYNAILDGNSGLLPGRLVAPRDMPLLGGDAAPDLAVSQTHPMVEPLAAVGDNAFGLVRVARSYGLEIDRDQSLGVRTVIRRRDKEPFVVEHRLGEGRVVSTLGGLENLWSNWTGDPTFVVFLLRCNAFLWSTANPDTERMVSDPLIQRMRPEEFGRSVELLAAADAPPRYSIQIQAEADEENKMLEAIASPATVALDNTIDLPMIIQPGIYEWWRTRIDGTRSVEPIASVISGNEGDLRRAARTDVGRALRPTTAKFYDAGEIVNPGEASGRGGRTELLLALLACLLLGEQVLAYFGSYHPPIGAKA